MKLLILSISLLFALVSFSYPIAEANETIPEKSPKEYNIPVEKVPLERPFVFVPSPTCKLEVIELEDLTTDKINACVKKDHSWLKI